MALFPGLPGWAGTRKVKPIWILLKQETVSGSGISWGICKSTPRSRQITTPTPHHSVFTGRMPFLPPNQQRQSTEGKKHCYNYTIHIKRTSTDVITVRAHKAHKLKSSNYIFINCINHTHCSFFIKHTSHINSLSHACYKTKSTGLVISTMKGLYKT